MLNPILQEDIENIHKIIQFKGEWKSSTILITGCAGFLGFYFLNYFTLKAQDLGIKKIIALDNFLLKKPSWLGDLKAKFNSILHIVKFDVSKDDISKIESADSVNYIIHAASIASPSFYRKYPIQTLDANIIGLRSLLDFYMGKESLKGMIFFSSSEIYGDPDQNNIPTSENYRGNVNCVGPRSCYDESKRFGETLCWIYAKEFNMPIIVARPFNNFGPGMKLEDKRLPADFAKSIIKGDDIYIFSDGSPTRTFCYISDAIIGYLLCLTHGRYDYFNIGIDYPEISVRDFALLFKNLGAKIFKYNGDIVYETSDDINYLIDNPNRRCPSIKKAREILGYNPKVTVEKGIERYLKFLKENL